MGAGCGAAVSAATWAGERICRAAAQPTIARATSAATARAATRLCRAPCIVVGDQPTLAAATQIAKTENPWAVTVSALSTRAVHARPPASG